MNKWIIFIIIVGIVSVIGILITIVGNKAPAYEEVAVPVEETIAQQQDQNINFVNTSQYHIAPGVFVLHNPNFSMNFLGETAPKEYESLAEVGDPSAALIALREHPDVYGAFDIAMIDPGGVQSIDMPEGKINRNTVVSYMAMIVETNDGVVWLNSVPLHTNTGAAQQESIIAEILDMGTEKNAPIGSGFAGGQPDLTLDTENINNGTPTNEPVQHHPQFYEDNTTSDEIVRVDLNV